MDEAVRLNSLFGVHISRDIALLIQSIFLARQILKISSLVHTPMYCKKFPFPIIQNFPFAGIKDQEVLSPN